MADLKEAPSVDDLIAQLRKEEEYSIERVKRVTEEKIAELRLANETLKELPKDVPDLLSAAAAVFVVESDFCLGQVNINGVLLGEIKRWPGEALPASRWDTGPAHRVRVIVAVIDKGRAE